MRLPNGIYKTANGSTVKISGKHSGIVEIEFDRYSEDACDYCQVQKYPELFAENDWRLVWYCEKCRGGNAKLIPEGCFVNNNLSDE